MHRMLALSSILLIVPSAAQARWGGQRLAGIPSSVTALSKKVSGAVSRRYATYQQNRQIKRNIKELRRTCPELDRAYLQASRSFKKSNRGNLVVGVGCLVQATLFGTISAGNYASGNPVMGTAFAVGTGSSAILSGQLIRGHYKGARLSGQLAVMEKLGSSKTIRRQVGDRVLPVTAKVYVAHFESEQRDLAASIEAAKQKIARHAEKVGLSKRVVAALKGLGK